MNLSTTLIGRAFFAAVMSILIVACETSAPLPPPPILKAPTPAPAPPVPQTVQTPPIYVPPPLNIPVRAVSSRLNDALIRASGNYAVIMQRVRQASTETISSTPHLNSIMSELAQFFSPNLGPSLLGYGALIGAQNPNYASSVLETARYLGKDTIIYALYSNPDYAAEIANAPAAALEIRRAWDRDISDVTSAAQAIKQQSYDLQKQAEWKKQKSDSRAERIAVFENASNLRYNPPETLRTGLAKIGALSANPPLSDTARRTFFGLFGRTPPQQSTQAPAYAPQQYISKLEKKALTLAALETLGASGQASTDWINSYMTSPGLAQCQKTARLNAQQCVAAGYFKYEDAFCAAEHQLADISACMVKVLR